jgi:hypothetical protein
MRAVYEDECGEVLEGQIILGAQFDWLSTGPLTPGDPRQRGLYRTTTLTDEKLAEGWDCVPEAGYDTYRRIDAEKAWGELRGCYIYLCADMRIDESEQYWAFLTADDTAHVYLDGKLLIAQSEGGPGEGRMVRRRAYLQAGTRRLFVRLYQAPMADPTGARRLRMTPNRCNMKLLIRSSRQQPAETIKTLPMQAYRRAGATP